MLERLAQWLGKSEVVKDSEQSLIGGFDLDDQEKQQLAEEAGKTGQNPEAVIADAQNQMNKAKEIYEQQKNNP